MTKVRQSTVDLLFILLQTGLGISVEDRLHSDLILTDSNIDWDSVYSLAKEQGVIAIAYDGLNRLLKRNQISSKCRPSKKLIWDWVAATVQIEKRYEQQKHVALAIADILEESKIQAFIFKGLSLSLCYPVPSHRECGDIDLYPCGCSVKQFRELLIRHGGQIKTKSSKHDTIIFQGVIIEIHHLFISSWFSVRNRRLNVLLLNELKYAGVLFGRKGLLQPTRTFNELFILAHAANHFKLEGLVLRHLLDWYFIDENNNLDWSLLSAFGLERLGRVFRELIVFFNHPYSDNLSVDARSVFMDMIVPDKFTEGSVLRKKYRRFISRRWTYSIVDEYFCVGVIRTIWQHVLDPLALFRERN